MKYIALLTILVLSSCATTDSGTGADPGESPIEANTDQTLKEQMEMADISGVWKGDLVVGERKIPFIFNVAKNEDGTFSSTLDSPSENITGIPVESVEQRDGMIIFSLPVTSATFEAVLNAEGNRLEGSWKQRGAELALNVVRSDGNEFSGKPQDPVPPYPYRVAEVAFRNEPANITLKGTITYPDGNGPFPGVVLISGSGQQNRDEEIFGHKPFLVLADSLTRAGVAVLRYDDRGAGESEGLETLATATTADFAQDAFSAHQFLSSLPGIDTAKVGLIGHSEGGMIAPMLASEHDEIAFIVLLSAPGVRGDDLIVSQSAAMLQAAGAPEATVQAATDINTRVYAAVLANPDNDTATPIVSDILTKAGMSQEQIDAQLTTLLSPAYRYILSFDPIPYLEALTVPVLALNGTLDLQVPFEANLAAIEGALETAPTTQYVVEAIPDLNHLFQTAKTGHISEYGQLEETFSPVALRIITNWISNL